MNKKMKSFEIVLVLVLSISIMLNIILLSVSYKDNYKAGKESYNSILSVRAINETNNEILKKAIDSGNIDNLELLKLYQNYSNISEDIADLWYEYSYYRESRMVFQKVKEIDTDNVMINEVHERIEDYFQSILETEMTTQNYNVSEKLLNNFKVMLEISNKIKDYYNKIFDEKLDNVNEEERLKKIVRKHYWIDILNKLNEVDNKYIDYEFTLE